MKRKLLAVVQGEDRITLVRDTLNGLREDFIMEPDNPIRPKSDEVRFFVDEEQHSRLSQELLAVMGP